MIDIEKCCDDPDYQYLDSGDDYNVDDVEYVWEIYECEACGEQVTYRYPSSTPKDERL